MPSRPKLLLIVTVLVTCLIAVVYALSATILLNGFTQVETQDAQRNVERAQDAISALLTSLDSATGDWANWDDAYQFVEDANPRFIQTNLTDDAFTQLDVDFIVFVDSAGRTIYAKAFDRSTQQAQPFPPSFSQDLAAGSALLQHPDSQPNINGIIVLPEGPLLVASRPILTSKGSGPTHGTLLFGRFLDADEIKTLAETTNLSLMLERFNDPQLPPDYTTARANLLAGNPIFVNPTSSEVIAGYATLRDTNGNPALLLRVELPRSIYAQARLTTLYLLASLVAVGIILLLVTYRGLGHLTARRETEERYRAVVEQTSEGIFICDLATGCVLEANAAFENLLGLRSGESIGRSVELFSRNLGKGSGFQLGANEGEQQYVRQDGTLVDVEVSSNLIAYDSRQVSCVVVRDITARKRSEQEMISLAKFPSENPNPVLRLALDGTILYANDASAPFLEAWGRRVAEKVPEAWQQNLQSTFASALNQTIEIDLNRRSFSCVLTPIAAQGYINLYARDITTQKTAEQSVERQLRHLSALHEIDLAISSSLDLSVMLNVFLDQVITQLEVDAATVLLVDVGTWTLEYAAARGFRTKAAQHTRTQLGNSPARSAVLERTVTHISNLAAQSNTTPSAQSWRGEDFVSYYGVPLLAKGQVVGVLEIYQRAPLEGDEEWLSFLEALAQQAAIGIEDARLFSHLERSNLELTAAYDATIEGWSHALELRDKETKGHTLRVTEITVQLATAMGMSSAELVQMRRGALLHDIGKMGVPDSILHKPGALTEQEWVIMKKHPRFAYEMLSPIRYLQAALDIPYCHHEKWDGTGYPRSLKGEQIPLAARIFAVVDVWDALTSDRPYRAAWSKEKTREYLRAQAGTHFDPQVVKRVIASGLLETQALETQALETQATDNNNNAQARAMELLTLSASSSR